MDGIQKACDVINNFKNLALKFTEEVNIRLFATASLRNIENTEEAVNIIAHETSLVPDVLGGEDEAALGFSGASQFAGCDGNGIMIDIGGASTEFVLFRDYQPEKLVSLPIGCLNLSVAYIEDIIPTGSERKQIKAAIKKELAKLDWEKDEKFPLMIGTGGTLRAALKLSRILFAVPPEENQIDAGYVKMMSRLLRKKEDKIYFTVYKAIPERLMTISTGLLILQQAIRKFGCETISVSKFGIREGYLSDRVLRTDDRYVIDSGYEEN